MKKEIYIFNEDGIAGMYGIGTFIKSLEKIFSNSQYNLTLINLNSNGNETSLSSKDGINIIDIPRARYYSQREQTIYYENLIYLLRLLIPYYDNENVFFFNYQCNGQMIPLLKKYYRKSQMIFIIHYLNWTLEIQGNTTLFKHIINNRLSDLRTEKENRIYRLYQESLNVFNQADKIVCLSQYTKQLLCEEYSIQCEKIYLISNGLQDNATFLCEEEKNKLRTSLYFDKKEKLILYVGRLDKYKGAVELIEAFRILLEGNPYFRLIIIGSGNDSIYFQQTENIWSKVIFTGKIDKDLVYKFYQIADVGVLPSFSEQCSYVAIEMMMHGLPIIGTDSTGLSEMILDGINGYKVNLKESEDNVILDSSELSELIKKIINDPKHQKHLSRGSRIQYLSKYTFDLMKKQYNNILRK